jgi:hypothetical protein
MAPASKFEAWVEMFASVQEVSNAGQLLPQGGTSWRLMYTIASAKSRLKPFSQKALDMYYLANSKVLFASTSNVDYWLDLG